MLNEFLERRSGADAKNFAPHQFTSRIQLAGGVPRIILTRDAYKDTLHLVDICPVEVGWMGHIQRVGQDLLVHKIFIVDQQVNGSTCELDSEALGLYAMSLLFEPDGEELFNSIRFWGHSHGTMDTSPSGQDEQQLRELASRSGDYFLRGIFNKHGRAEFTLALPSQGVWIRDLPWEVEHELDMARHEHWQTEVAAKVREKVYLPPAYIGLNGFGAAGTTRVWDEDEVVPAVKPKGKKQKKGGQRW